MLSNESEERLLLLAQQGDEYAFDLLVALLEIDVRRFITSLVGYQPDEDDIVQMTSLALFMNLERLEVSRLRPFVFRVTRNLCYDHLRRLGRFEPVALEAVILRDPQPTPEDIHAKNDTVELLKTALLKLPEHQRQVLILYAEAQLSYAEIAETLNISIGTVKSRLHHARQTLRGLVSYDLSL